MEKERRSFLRLNLERLNGKLGMPMMLASVPSSATPTISYQIKDKNASGGEAICAVCGDGHAKLHYGYTIYRVVPEIHYVAVRPDRDLTGKQKVPRIRKKPIDEELLSHVVVKGDNNMSNATTQQTRDPRNISLKEMFEQKPSMDGRRTEMRYEPFRMARTEELSEIAHRRAIAAVDWVDSLTEIAELQDTEDKVALVKSCYSPLTIFNFSARTAQNTPNPDILCLCSHPYVPRRLPPEFNETKFENLKITQKA
ncbi:hypothetical protein TELCIR_16783 [Teladorsagia circumcincta]|uniref:NR LBD domain-containing protein n=1 Tax=Teladorsagia circumcincta TaxID=45464 RepID=A0A2G9TUJ1_TELCI|nr:hypothetical protein TELCIR_16783 [Teladorsagia circumcincta]